MSTTSAGRLDSEGGPPSRTIRAGLVERLKLPEPPVAGQGPLRRRDPASAPGGAHGFWRKSWVALVACPPVGRAGEVGGAPDPAEVLALVDKPPVPPRIHPITARI